MLLELKANMTSSSLSAEDQAGSFLAETVSFARTPSSPRPHVTLTFAQSEDGKIAGPEKTQLALSGKESMIMTHKLRTLHDGILVGIGTVLNDNPQLNARLLSKPPSVPELPRPIVLDSTLRMPVDCKLIRNHTAGVGRRPLVLSSTLASSQRRKVLEEAGVEVVQVEPSSSDGKLEWSRLLERIYDAGVRRLMVEGGAAVIDSLMQQPQHIDLLLVTIAPVTVGPKGFGFVSQLPDRATAEGFTSWSEASQCEFGKDEVVVWHRR